MPGASPADFLKIIFFTYNWPKLVSIPNFGTPCMIVLKEEIKLIALDKKKWLKLSPAIM